MCVKFELCVILRLFMQVLASGETGLAWDWLYLILIAEVQTIGGLWEYRNVSGHLGNICDRTVTLCDEDSHYPPYITTQILTKVWCGVHCLSSLHKYNVKIIYFIPGLPTRHSLISSTT